MSISGYDLNNIQERFVHVIVTEINYRGEYEQILSFWKAGSEHSDAFY